MAVDVIMPNLGFDTQTARLIEWLKKPGDSVTKGESLAVIESDKANVELESVTAGVVLELLVLADTEVPIGSVIARVGARDENPRTEPVIAASPRATASSLPPEISPVARRLAQEHQIDLSRVSGSGPSGKIMRDDVEALIKPVATNGSTGILALPKVRKAAREAGIDLAQITASGSKGQITLADLEHYQAASSQQPVSMAQTVASSVETVPTPALTSSVRENAREIPLSRSRKIIGERLSKSKQDAPHFYVSGEFDVESAMQHLPVKVRMNDFIQYLTVQTLLRVPELNATYENDRLYYYDEVNLGIAVALDDSLITPVLRHAQRYSLQGIAAEGHELIERTREKRLKPDDLQGATFTISNLGMVKQVERFTAVINPPQVAILAVGTVQPRPVVINGGLHIHNTVYLTLSGDHRAVDGMHLARFMAAFQAELDKIIQ
jgi:pyruvate dehydrogenase E2 component (dihydrolipoamide acetyltransferase)